MKKDVQDLFTVGWSPDLKHFKIAIHDIEECASKKVQDHMYSALNKYLRTLRNHKGADHGTTIQQA